MCTFKSEYQTTTWHSALAAQPKYSLATDYLEVEAGSSPSVTFTVTSLAEGTGHTLRKSGGGEVSKRFRVESGHIIFRRLRSEDSGMYTISVATTREK